MKKIYNIFELLKLIQRRPGIYLWNNQSIGELFNFLYWYQFGISTCWYEEKFQNKLFYRFQDYVVENTIWKKNITDDCFTDQQCLLKFCNWDEKKAFHLFFELLDRFIEKEKIKIDIPEPPDYSKM